jgi:hypothetical protein
VYLDFPRIGLLSKFIPDTYRRVGSLLGWLHDWHKDRHTGRQIGRQIDRQTSAVATEDNTSITGTHLTRRMHDW